MSNRFVHVERKAGHTVHDTVADTYAPFMTSDDADSAASLLNIFGDVLGFVWLTADKVDEYEAGLPDPETDNPDYTGSADGDVD
jgi:hypothetical protein